MSKEVWQQVYARVVDLIKAHGTKLVFVNTRKMAPQSRYRRGLSNRKPGTDVDAPAPGAEAFLRSRH
jgi:Lhr-like helicase